ncbi:hypothetical protein KP509_29G035000 [Ceratopteris richardii]|uniref:TF-B3 domain-containing protein n=1 Tax=Ceratopteris richardii TaxID=49495 RepID=A0A8T2R7K9_CERRI|nr:hypothetical protein KP509_29G035000 [Ceratopteris richardii]
MQKGKAMLLSQDVHPISTKKRFSKSSIYSNVSEREIEASREYEKNKVAHTVRNDYVEIATCDLPSKVQSYNKPQFTLKDLQQVYHSLHSYSSSNPFTIRMMVRSNVCCGYKVGIPNSFAVKHMKADPEHVALIDARNKAWSVIFLGHKNDHPSFSGGWKYFVLDHKLKCGDICIFEKMSTKAFTAFNVHTFRVHKGDRQELVNKIPPRLSSVIARRCT